MKAPVDVHHLLDEHEVGAHEESDKVERYPVATIDFGRVETPFIIGVWILFASIAKIGECLNITQTFWLF